MTNGGVLLLSHCGFSFMEDLVAALNARGLRSFVLSSSPLPEQAEKRLEALSRMSARLITTKAGELTWDDVGGMLRELQESGERVLACITVWEGYRELMARANTELGVLDLAADQVSQLRDKLSLRNRLAQAALSNARAVALTQKNFEALKSDARRYFIKPVCGIASYAAFSLRPDFEWSTLERISSEAKNDRIYRSAFGSDLTFMAEDFVPGREFSFELLVVNGRLHVLAIHEKCELTETAGTVLEDCCISPPVSIDSDACAAGIDWVNRVFRELGLRWGCFHFEARYDGARWDLIEINPRVGGCLISPSVQALNGVASMLELWLDLLMASADEDSVVLAELERTVETLSYRANGMPPSHYATFFRAYFAKPGKLESVDLREIEPVPIVRQLFLKPGDEIAESSREVFLGQMLWRVPFSEYKLQLPDLIRVSARAVEVRYAADGLANAATYNEVIEKTL
ncbi:ATP-grasp domain-containing protein [Caballeronia sp. J97]|uniref:ATP-grasp domain-containing protein n=1 Tax=Caballeronia sp. J97 TaxID=2805429 RepID=UPI002AB2F691|nr:ATP-grasp domain-containing protein [Caballeronia sp. J97]